jgi:uncharacterized glyoxalase superfamily protein PhnB
MAVAFARVSPILPVRNVTAALAHYAKLGFEASAYGEKAGGDPIYAFVSWGPVELHLARFPDLDPKTSSSACYLYVDDANALHAQWLVAGVGGKSTAPIDTPYGLREFTHVDPDGNLLRVGSPLPKT